jgi:uncharacterized membrane protein
MAMKNFARYFLRGSLVLVPLAATIYIVFLILRTIDQILPIGVPGLGLVLTVGLITLVGFLTSNVLGRTAFDALDKALTSVPFIKLVYSSIRDLIGAFVGDKKSFDKPVMVSLSPGSGTKVLGFTTRERLEMLGLTDHVAVYLPQSYNFAGNLIVVPRVSGGVSGFGVGTSLPPLSMRSPPRVTPS